MHVIIGTEVSLQEQKGFSFCACGCMHVSVRDAT